MPVNGGVLRSWRRSLGWDVPEMARRLRQAAGDGPVPVHDALVRMVRYWESGQRKVTERYELLYAAALDIEPDLLGSGPNRGTRDLRSLGSDPAPPFRPVSEAIDLGAWMEETNAGDGTVGYLAAAAKRLAGDYTRRPPLTVMKDAVELQRRATALLRGGHQRLGQARDLCRICAEVFALLALLCSDLGRYPAAEAYGHSGGICAHEAGSDRAGALVLSAQAKTAQWQQRYAQAAARARQGYEMCPPSGARVLLACQEANAAQALGDATRAAEALARGRSAQDAAPVCGDDDGMTAWSCPPPREANYAAIVTLGRDDLGRSLQAASRADEAWAAGAPWVYGTWAQVRIGAAIVRARQGEATGAAEEIAPVLTIPAEYRVVTITGRLGLVSRLLQARRYRGSQVAADLSERIAEFSASSLGVKAIGAPDVL